MILLQSWISMETVLKLIMNKYEKIIVIICIFMIFLLTGCQDDQISPTNEVSLQYDSLDNFYGDETLEKSFSR